MKLTNHTRFPAGIARMVYADDRIAASVLVRVLYERKSSRFVPADAQPWIVSMTPWEGPKGGMDGDLVFYKDGVDVFLFGTARAAGGRSVAEMEVGIRIESNVRAFQRRVRVTGPRVWTRRVLGSSGLAPTSPLPFTALPLALDYAFGGKDEYDGLAVAWPENPEGLGFYIEEQNAVDKPLPCIEEIDAPIAKWDDRPAPAGLVPLPVGSPLRARQGLSVDAGSGQSKLTPRYFNAAFSRMIAAGVQPGAAVTVSGVSISGPVVMSVPVHPMFIRLRFGSEEHDLPMSIDQVAILADEDQLMIAYRCPFRYVVRAMEKRHCELFERAS